MSTIVYDDTPADPDEVVALRCANCGRPLKSHEDLGPWIVTIHGDHLALLCSRECEAQLAGKPLTQATFTEAVKRRAGL